MQCLPLSDVHLTDHDPYDKPGTVPYLAPEPVEGKTYGRAQ